MITSPAAETFKGTVTSSGAVHASVWVSETKIPHGVHDRSLDHEPHNDIDAAIGIVIMESRN